MEERFPPVPPASPIHEGPAPPASPPPGPFGEPCPVLERPPGTTNLGKWVLGVALADGLLFALILPTTMVRTLGATRSARLRWEERRAEIEKAVEEEMEERPNDGMTE